MGKYTVPCLNTYPLQTANVILLWVFFATPLCYTFLPCFQQQVDDFLNVYCSVPESIQKENAWETQTYVHFCDGQGVALTLKPEHRVEDVLSLACKVLTYCALLHLVNSCGLEKERNISGFLNSESIIPASPCHCVKAHCCSVSFSCVIYVL